MTLPLLIVNDKWATKNQEEMNRKDSLEEGQNLLNNNIESSNTQTFQYQTEQNNNNEQERHLEQNQENEVRIESFLANLNSETRSNTNPKNNLDNEIELDSETSIFEIIKTLKFWSGALAFGLLQPPFIFLSCDYAFYLKLHNITEQTSSINTSFVLGIGIVGGILVNFSKKYNFMAILLYIIMTCGMCLIALSTILVRQGYISDIDNSNALETLMLFIGETLFGVGIIGNLSFVTMTLCSLYPKIDYSILLALPQTIGTLFAVMFCTMIMKLGDWAMFAFSLFYYLLCIFLMITLKRDKKKKEIVEL